MSPPDRAALAVRCSTCPHATTDRRTCMVSGLTLTAHVGGEPCPKGIAPGVVRGGMPAPVVVAPTYSSATSPDSPKRRGCCDPPTP